MIDACVSLLQEAPQVPTATEIARRAGCSTRLVFVHFGDLMGLVLPVAYQSLAVARGAAVARNVDADRATRIATQVEIRAGSCETWLPLWRVALAVQNKSKELRSFIEFVHAITIKRLELMYARELATLAALERRQLLIALEAIVDFQSWGRMRDDQGLSVEQARTVWTQVIDRMLPPTPPALIDNADAIAKPCH